MVFYIAIARNIPVNDFIFLVFTVGWNMKTYFLTGKLR